MIPAQLFFDFDETPELNENLILPDDPRWNDAVKQLAHADLICVDLETQAAEHDWEDSERDALCPFRDAIRTVQVGLPNDLALLYDLGSTSTREYDPHGFTQTKFFKVLKERLENRRVKVVAHNAYFECTHLYYHFGVKVRCVRDTMIMSRMTYAGTTFRVKHNLGEVIKRHLGVEIDKSQGKEFDWRLPITEKQLNYCYNDCIYPIDIYEAMRKFLVPQGKDSVFRKNWARACQAECDVIPVFAEMAIDGYPIDQPMLNFVIWQHQKVYDYLLENDFYKHFPSNLKHSDTTKTIIDYFNNELNMGVEYDYEAIQAMHKDKRPSIKEILFAHMNKPPVEALFRVRKLKKTLDYLYSVQTNTFNGCVHTNYSTLADECAGRSSSKSWLKNDNTSGMNIQNPGKRLEDKWSNEIALELTGEELLNLRTIFASRLGEKLIIIDLPQAHYMIATESGNDKVAKKMFAEKVDQHSLVGATVAKGQGKEAKYHDWEYIQKAQSDKKHPDNAVCKKFRKYGKIGNYSQLNGSGSKTMDKANHLGIEANDLIRQSWSETFVGINQLMKKLVREANYKVYSANSDEPHIKEFFNGVKGEWGVTYGFDGRPLWLPVIKSKYGESVYPSKCYSQHWLSCEKTIMAIGMIKMQYYFDDHPEFGARFVNMAHDEVNIVCKSAFVEEVAEHCNHILLTEFKYYISDTQVNWDDWRDSIGYRWSDK